LSPHRAGRRVDAEAVADVAMLVGVDVSRSPWPAWAGLLCFPEPGGERHREQEAKQDLDAAVCATRISCMSSATWRSPRSRVFSLRSEGGGGKRDIRCCYPAVATSSAFVSFRLQHACSNCRALSRCVGLGHRGVAGGRMGGSSLNGNRSTSVSGYDPGAYGRAVAARYDDLYRAVPETEEAVDLLAALAGDGAVLEMGIGTGRLALGLRRVGSRFAGSRARPRCSSSCGPSQAARICRW